MADTLIVFIDKKGNMLKQMGIDEAKQYAKDNGITGEDEIIIVNNHKFEYRGKIRDSRVADSILVALLGVTDKTND